MITVTIKANVAHEGRLLWGRRKINGRNNQKIERNLE